MLEMAMAELSRQWVKTTRLHNETRTNGGHIFSFEQLLHEEVTKASEVLRAVLSFLFARVNNKCSN